MENNYIKFDSDNRATTIGVVQENILKITIAYKDDQGKTSEVLTALFVAKEY